MGKISANLDLFHELDKYFSSLEREGLRVGFWHVERKVRSFGTLVPVPLNTKDIHFSTMFWRIVWPRTGRTGGESASC